MALRTRMSDMSLTRVSQTSKRRRKAPGCLGWGCLTVALVGVIAILLVGAGFYRMYDGIRNFTSDRPMKVPKAQLTAAQLANVNTRIEAFTKGAEAGKSRRLTLSMKELNVRINAWRPLRLRGVRLYVERIENGHLVALVSMPFDAIPVASQVPGLRGRYVNGRARFAVSVNQGVLVVKLLGFEANRKRLPDEVLVEIGKENLAGVIVEDPGLRILVSKLKSIAFADGQVIVES